MFYRARKTGGSIAVNNQRSPLYSLWHHEEESEQVAATVDMLRDQGISVFPENVVLLGTLHPEMYDDTSEQLSDLMFVTELAAGTKFGGSLVRDEMNERENGHRNRITIIARPEDVIELVSQI